MEGNRAARRAAMRGLGKKRRSAIVSARTERSDKGPQDIPASTEVLKVFRIEHPESGQGPFTHQTGRGIFAADAMVYMKEPQEMCKGLGRGGCPLRYAFDSPETMMGNIERFILLRECGFNFSVYESHYHIVLPDGQVAFSKEKATLLETHPVAEFPFENYF